MAKQDNGKLIAILSYITIIGWVIALVMNQNEKSKLGSYHIRQALMIMVTAFVASLIPLLGMLLLIVVIVFWVMGLVSAIQEQMKPVPIIGDLAQQWFKGL